MKYLYNNIWKYYFNLNNLHENIIYTTEIFSKADVIEVERLNEFEGWRDRGWRDRSWKAEWI